MTQLQLLLARIADVCHIQYINILTWLRGFQVNLLYLVLFSFYLSLLGIGGQNKLEKFAILTQKQWRRARLLIKIECGLLGTSKFNAGGLPCIPSSGGGGKKNIHSTEARISSRLMGHLARIHRLLNLPLTLNCFEKHDCST